MPDENREKQALIDRIIASDGFEPAPKQQGLLRFLFTKADEHLMAWQIEEQYFKRPRESKYHNEAHAREAIAKLQERLSSYAESAPQESWVVELPPSTRNLGYRLKVYKKATERSASERFWLPHLEEPEKIMVICNSHLFFYDQSNESMFRFSNVNSEGDREAALAELNALHPEAYKATLERNHFYLSAGEVIAHEKLLHWFHKRSGILIPRYVSRDVLDRQIHEASPILLGRSGANRFIRKIAKAEGKNLAYRFSDNFGDVQINNIKEEYADLSRFTVSDEGILKHPSDWETVFGIVTRLPNPSGSGPMTIIAADYYARVITQITGLLTDDKSLALLLEKMELPGDELPAAFQILFGVRLSPGSFEGEGQPFLICWREITTNSDKR